MNEEWKDIEGYEGRYQISNIGRVRSYVNNGKGLSKIPKILNLSVSDRGYARVNLRSYGKLKTLKVHRLVAIAFIDNPSNYKEINHIDGDKLNNSIDNLEWCDRSRNVRHSFETNLREGPNKGKYGKKSARTRSGFIKNPFGQLIYFSCLKDFCEINKLDKSCLYQLLRGNQSQHKGWRVNSD